MPSPTPSGPPSMGSSAEHARGIERESSAFAGGDYRVNGPSSSSVSLHSSRPIPSKPSYMLASSQAAVSGPIQAPSHQSASMSTSFSRDPARSKSTLENQVNVHEDKFHEPTSHFIPTTLACWTTALESVNTNQSSLVQHKNFKVLQGYLVLDPYVLATGNPAESRFWIYVTTWLSIRCSWIAFITTRSNGESTPTPQQWRSYLSETLGRNMGLFDLDNFRNGMFFFRLVVMAAF